MDESVAYPSADPAISLYYLLDKGFLEGRYLFPEKHKLILAFNLAHTLLQFYSTPWVQNDWTAERLLFMYEADKARVFNIHQPYTACSLSGRTYKSEDEDRVHKYPFILSFGKLLLEIGEGKVIVVDKPKVGKSNLLRSLKIRFDQRCKEEQLSKDYARAINV
jgi:hypothetical protein